MTGAIDMAAVCLVNEGNIYASELSEAYKAAVTAALPSGVEPLDVFWRELAAVAAGYIISQQNRGRRRSPAAAIEYWQSVAKAATESDGKKDRALAAVKNLAEAQIAAYQAIKGDFSRKKNAHREGLYIGILDLWCRGLGQRLGVSGVDKPQPGPLIKFFSACVNPLLSKPLTGNGIAQIVDREKRRYEKHMIWREKIRRDVDPS
jgi:hypothetical protein